MKNEESSSGLYSFYDYFVSFSRKRLEELINEDSFKEKEVLESNLGVCIENYEIVTKVAERLLSLRKNSKMLSNIKIEYKYHDQIAIEKAYFNSIDYVDRLYHGMAEDFMNAIKIESSLRSFYFAETEFNHMMKSFMSSYSEIVNGTYIPVLKIII
ncbi:MAG: hypothetical protein ACP5MV_01180 [Candidatus Parvarchaeum sp.]